MSDPIKVAIVTVEVDPPTADVDDVYDVITTIVETPNLPAE